MKWLNTKEGLVIYDAECKRLDAALERATPYELMSVVEQWMKGKEDALMKLRVAFYADTNKFNSLSACMATSASDMRLFVKMVR